MGIVGLLTVLKEKGCLLPTNLEELRGSVAAVDISCWIYASLSGHGNSPTNSAFTAEILDRINQLIRAGIKPMIVFDGNRPPAKDATAALRQRTQDRMELLALACEAKGDILGAEQCRKKKLSRSVVSVPVLTKLFRSLNIPFIVSPFEADAQIAALERQGLVNLIVTLDSDMIIYGCKRVLFGLKRNGIGLLYEQVKLSKQVLGAPFELDRLRWCSILIGCDYYHGGVKGVGRVTAMRLYAKTKHITDLEVFFQYVESQLKVEVSFREKFMVAERTFLHQIIFDVQQKVMKHLSPAPPSQLMPYVGSLTVTPGEYTIDPETLSGMELPPVFRKYFTCPVCKEVAFDTREEKKDHWMKVHQREKRPYKCNSCPSTFVTFYNLTRHLRSHAGLKPFKCNVCGTGFRDINLVKSHMARHKLGEITYPCEECGKVLLYRSSLFTHRQAHANLRQFQCDKCDRSFAFRSYLQKHAAVHSKEQKYQCPHCSAKFTQVGSRNTHVKQQHTNPQRWKCESCVKEYSSKKNLTRHQRQSHKKN